MEFELISFLKVVVVVACHTGFLYFIFRQLDKIFGVNKPILHHGNSMTILGGDLYLLQVRASGGCGWSDAAAPGPYTAPIAGEMVANLNAAARGAVYRAVLIGSANSCDK